jgi:glycine cleavage system H protein
MLMSLILAVTVATIIVLIQLLRKDKPAKATRPVLVKRYVHPGHAWMKVTQDGDVVVGIDEFSQSVIGSVDAVELPRLLRKVRQGEVGWKVKHGSRVVPMRSPVSGRVVEKNEMVQNNPSLVNSSPYGDGWLFKVRPGKLNIQLSNLFTGHAAARWQDMQRSELARFFSGTPALMFQEGGVLLHNLANKCSEKEWNEITRQFFQVETD